MGLTSKEIQNTVDGAVDAELIQSIFRRLNHDFEMRLFHWSHDVIWGVPCGPTLTMVHPTQSVDQEYR